MAIEKYSATWEAVTTRAKAEIASLQLALERGGDHAVSERIRGSIAAYRELLGWANEPAVITAPDELDDHGLAP